MFVSIITDYDVWFEYRYCVSEMTLNPLILPSEAGLF